MINTESLVSALFNSALYSAAEKRGYGTDLAKMDLRIVLGKNSENFYELHRHDGSSFFFSIETNDCNDIMGNYAYDWAWDWFVRTCRY